MLTWLDRLAGWWLQWRTERAAAKLNLGSGWEFKRADVTPDGMTILAHAPNIVGFAEEAASLLDACNAENYVQVDILPRVDRARRPIWLTVQWLSGESPAARAHRLEQELAALKETRHAND